MAAPSRVIAGALLLAGAGAGALLWAPGENRAASAAPSAPACALPPADLEPALRAIPGATRVSGADGVDPDSGEPVRRNRIVFADGQAIAVEQKSCMIANVQVTALSQLALPDAAAQGRIAAVLKAWPLWTRNFAAIDPARFVAGELASPAFRRGLGQIAGKAPGERSFTYASEALPATGETSETLVTYQANDPPADGARSRFTLTISAGD